MNNYLPLYVDYPLYIKQINISGTIIQILCQANTLKKIDFVTFIFKGEKVSFPFDNKNVINEIIIRNDSYFSIEPKLYSVFIDGKEVIFDENIYTRTYIVSPRSIFNFGDERYLYKKQVSTLCSVEYKNVKFIAEDYDSYWNCCCGETNLSVNHNCIKCNADKKKLCDLDFNYEKERNKKIKENKIDLNFIIIFSTVLFFQVIFQALFGDFFFDNYTKNNFYGILNRFIIPFLLIITTFLKVYFSKKYMNALHGVFSWVRFILILYINFIFCSLTIYTCYNFLIFIIIDLFFLFSLLFNKKTYLVKKTAVNIILICICLIIGIAKIGIYSKEDLYITDNGVNIKISKVKEDFVVPEKIDHIKIYSIIFSEATQKKVSSIKLSKSLNAIYTPYASLFGDLERIDINGNHNFLFIEGILYSKSYEPKLILNNVEVVNINYETVPKYSFFKTRSIKKIIISSKVRFINEKSFQDCINLKEIYFEDDSHLEIIEDGAFMNCKSLTSLELPISLTKMGVGIFNGCDSLYSLSTPFLGQKREDNEDISNCLDLLSYLFGYRDYRESWAICPSFKELYIYDIDRIHNVTFYNAKYLEKIILPNELLHMGIRSFFGCESLKEFVIPNSVEIIEEGCFENCLSLGKIIIPNTVNKIEKNAFKNANELKEVIFLGNKENIDIEEEGNGVLIELIK